MIDSLAKPEDNKDNVIWDPYKNRVRPTVSSFMLKIKSDILTILIHVSLGRYIV